MAVWLRRAGENVDPLLVHRGGLLHDLAKLKHLDRPPEQRMHHGELGARMLADLGQPELAEITRRHPLFCLTQDALYPRTWEQKLVHLADKLIEGSRLVPLEERIAALRIRYAMDEARIIASLPALLALQGEVCAAIQLTEQDLIPNLRHTLLHG
jgi:putative hydrolase of the HAD superfamily